MKAKAKEFDVVAIDISRKTIIWVDGAYDKENADSVVAMAVMRQGVEDRFFKAVPTGKYVAGAAYAD